MAQHEIEKPKDLPPEQLCPDCNQPTLQAQLTPIPKNILNGYVKCTREECSYQTSFQQYLNYKKP